MDKKVKDQKTHSFQVRIDPELHALAMAKAREMDLTLSQVVRLLLKDWVAKKQQQMFF